MWVTELWDNGMFPVQWSVAIGLTLIGAAWDLHSRRIPNVLTFPGLLAGLAWSFYSAGPAGLADSLAACVLLALPFVLLFAFAGGGAGDAKLMGAVGAWLGLVNGLAALAGVALAGIMVALAFALAARRVRQVAGNVAGIGWAMFLSVVGRRKLPTPSFEEQPVQRIPYGLAICLGVIAAAGGVLLWRM